MVKKKWCGFHKRMEPIENFYKDSCAPDGYSNCCKKVKIKRSEASREKKFLKSLLQREVISEKLFFVEKEVIKQKYYIR